MIVAGVVLTRYRTVTDGQTDGRNLVANTALCIAMRTRCNNNSFIRSIVRSFVSDTKYTERRRSNKQQLVTLPPAVINCDTLSLCIKSRPKTHLFNTAYSEDFLHKSAKRSKFYLSGIQT